MPVTGHICTEQGSVNTKFPATPVMHISEHTRTLTQRGCKCCKIVDVCLCVFVCVCVSVCVCVCVCVSERERQRERER